MLMIRLLSHAHNIIHGYCSHCPTIADHLHSVLECKHVCTYHACLMTFRRSSESPLPAQEDFPFVEEPSKDFFCPVTYGLLLQPHLTACCGKHLSHKAATWIQKEGGRCPLCNEIGLKTMLDKGLQRKVNGLRVFCHHEDRGCGWQGELSGFEHHVQSCPMKTAPLIADLQKLPV